jgi:hypothetical protein
LETTGELDQNCCVGGVEAKASLDRIQEKMIKEELETSGTTTVL